MASGCGFSTGALARRRGGARPARPPLLVLFGSQSGNAESLAKRVNQEAATPRFSIARRHDGGAATAGDLAAAKKRAHSHHCTWGEGRHARQRGQFLGALNQNGTSPVLTGVNFSVLALGDRNYGETFCLAGRKFDERPWPSWCAQAL